MPDSYQHIAARLRAYGQHPKDMYEPSALILPPLCKSCSQLRAKNSDSGSSMLRPCDAAGSLSMKMDHECIGDLRAPSTVLQPAGSFRESDYCILNDHPCKIISRTLFKSGLHATSKVCLTGIGLFTGKIYEHICPISTSLEAPVVTHTAYQLIGITEESCAVLMNEAGDVKSDLKLPENEVGGLVRNMFEKEVLVYVIAAMREEKIVAAKENCQQ